MPNWITWVTGLRAHKMGLTIFYPNTDFIIADCAIRQTSLESSGLEAFGGVGKKKELKGT